MSFTCVIQSPLQQLRRMRGVNTFRQMIQEAVSDQKLLTFDSHLINPSYTTLKAGKTDDEHAAVHALIQTTSSVPDHLIGDLSKRVQLAMRLNMVKELMTPLSQAEKTESLQGLVARTKKLETIPESELPAQIISNDMISTVETAASKMLKAAKRAAAADFQTIIELVKAKGITGAEAQQEAVIALLGAYQQMWVSGNVTSLAIYESIKKAAETLSNAPIIEEEEEEMEESKTDELSDESIRTLIEMKGAYSGLANQIKSMTADQVAAFDLHATLQNVKLGD